MIDLSIDSAGSRKGRAFTATLAAFVTARHLFEESSGADCIRPAWALFAGPEVELRAFVANLRLGRKAGQHRDDPVERVEFLKSLRFNTAVQREPEGAFATLWHPDLFSLDPGMVEPSGIGFVMLAPEAWAAQQGGVDVGACLAHVAMSFPGCPLDRDATAALVPTACLFAAYLDRRTRCPLIPDPRFYLQVLLACLEAKMAAFPCKWTKYGIGRVSEWGMLESGTTFQALGLEDAGIRHAVAFKADHEAFEALLAEQVRVYDERTR